MSKIKISIKENGAIRIEAEEIELIDSEGIPYDLQGKNSISLCRCGLSQKKPFCDGSHNIKENLNTKQKLVNYNFYGLTI